MIEPANNHSKTMIHKPFYLLLALVALAATACHKPTSPEGRGYTIVSKIPNMVINQYDVDAHLFEYNGCDQRIDSFHIQRPRSGEPYSRLVGDSVSHIKLCITSFDTNVRWGDTIIFMRGNEHVPITIGVSLLYSTYALHEPMLHP